MEEEQSTVEYHIQDNSDVEGSILVAARRHYANGNYNEALRLLLDALNTSVNAELYIEVGNCYLKLQNYNEALEYFNKATNIDPRSSAAYSSIGNVYYKKGQAEKAISFWLAALVTKPEDYSTLLNLAIAYNSKSMQFEAVKYFERYLKYAEEQDSQNYNQVKQSVEQRLHTANEYLNLGMQYHSQNEVQKALDCYLTSWDSCPNLFTTNLNLGSIFFADKKLDLAIKYWKVASYIDVNNAKVYSNLAISYDMATQFDYAYCYYNRYMNLIINDREEYYKANKRLLKLKPYINENEYLIDIHLDRANEYLANAQYFDAIDEFKNYSILCPEKNHEYKELIKKLESYLNPELDIIVGCLEKGTLLMNSGRYAEAKPYFYRVMVLSSPQYSEYSKARSKFSQCERAEKGI